MNEKNIAAPSFTTLTELASERMGGQTLQCSDDFFAGMENLIKPGRGIFIEGKYTDHGKWMDGWESRRKREPGHDWCILKLGVPGKIKGVDIDTNHFLGNHPPHASIEACYTENKNIEDWNSLAWTQILDKSPLDPGSQNFYEIQSQKTWSHLRLNIFPDGGVARLKVYGQVDINWENLENEKTDLAAAVVGGRSISCNDMFFSSKDNINLPGRGINMGDGWETKRNRKPGNIDWLILELGHRGVLEEVVIDTLHFKGNYPDACSLEGCDLKDAPSANLESASWEEFLPKTKLKAHDEKHVTELSHHGPYTHIKLKIYPDGGISRLRVFGRPLK